MAMIDGAGVTPVYNLNGDDNGGFGMGGMWVFFLFFLLAWGGNGFGGFGNNGAESQINNDFLYSNLASQLRDNSIQNNTVLNSIQQGLCQLGYDNLSQSREIGSKIDACCCNTQKELLINRYEASKNTCDIINAGHADTQRIIDTLTQNTIQDLRDRLQAAEFGISQAAQTANIVHQVRPYPIPAYPVCSPSSAGFSEYKAV